MPQKVQSELLFFGETSREPDYNRSLAGKVVFMARLKPESLVLDAGCGEGYWGRVFADKGHQVVGIDLSPAVIRRAKKKSVPGQSFLVGNLLEKIPFYHKHFDLAFCGGILHHFPDKEDVETVIQNLRFYLKKDGEIILVEPNGFNPVVYLSRQIGRLLVRFCHKKDIASENEVMHSINTYLNILKKHGFEIQKIETCHSFMYEKREIQSLLDWFFYIRFILLELVWKYLPQPYKGNEVIIIAGVKDNKLK